MAILFQAFLSGPFCMIPPTENCVYCLGNQILRPEQILFRGEKFFLCAPRGQLVEGYLTVAPYKCIGCLASLPASWIHELPVLVEMVERFYQEAYDRPPLLVYEQGRAGGGASIDAASSFPLHAHLCFLPVSVSLRAHLLQTYEVLPLSGLNELSKVASGRPYLFIEERLGELCDRAVYVAKFPEDRYQLETMRLKILIADLLGLSERGNWRDHPGDDALLDVIQKFAIFKQHQTMSG